MCKVHFACATMYQDRIYVRSYVHVDYCRLGSFMQSEIGGEFSGRVFGAQNHKLQRGVPRDLFYPP